MNNHTKRKPLFFLGAAFMFLTLAQVSQAEEIIVDKERTIVGYADEMTVRPGETLNFMISTYAEGPYQADLVRIINSDLLAYPDRFRVDPVRAPFAGEYEADNQPIYIGSYVEIDDATPLDSLRNFTVQAWVYPTTPGKESQVEGMESGEPRSYVLVKEGLQHVVARFDDVANKGWSLALAEDGSAAFVIGNGKNRLVIKTGVPLRSHHWSSVTAVIDRGAATVTLYQTPRTESPGDRVLYHPVKHQFALPAGQSIPQTGVLRFAAADGGPGNKTRRRPAGNFNGKIDAVRLSAEALSLEDIQMLDAPSPPRSSKSLLGFWNFGDTIGSTQIPNRMKKGLDGQAVNIPKRAVTGFRWSGQQLDWRHARDEYSAIYFHDDDLYDAQWKPAFQYKVPKKLQSGIYAVRLIHGDSQDYIPFFVAPPRGVARANLAFMLPTATYLAYSNMNLQYDAKVRDQVNDPLLGMGYSREADVYPNILSNRADNTFLKNHPEMGKGVYRMHTDGSPVVYSSSLRPDVMVKPRGISYGFNTDTHILDWLELSGIDYDIITDELLDSEGQDLLSNYAVVLSGTHPEYVSESMSEDITAYLDRGGRWMYLGGNGYSWVASFHRELPNTIEVRKMEDVHTHTEEGESFNGFTPVRGGFIERRRDNTHRLFGVSYTGMDFHNENAGYDRRVESYSKRAAFIMEGVDDTVIGKFGVHANGAAGEEFNYADFAAGTPKHALILARAVSPDAPFGTNPIADLLFFETPNGGAMFATGSIAWGASLLHKGGNNNVSRITHNVISRFLDANPLVFSTAPENTDD